MGQMTQPSANSVKALKENRFPSSPPHRARNNTTMQHETRTHKIHTDKRK